MKVGFMTHDPAPLRSKCLSSSKRCKITTSLADTTGCPRIITNVGLQRTLSHFLNSRSVLLPHALNSNCIPNMSNPGSSAPSRDQTPNPGTSRFQASRATAEDVLKSQTEGLVSLSDYRKRRREAVELNESGRNSAAVSGTTTPLEG